MRRALLASVAETFKLPILLTSRLVRANAATRTRRLKTSGKAQTAGRSLACHVGAGRSTGIRMTSGAAPEGDPVAAVAAGETAT